MPDMSETEKRKKIKARAKKADSRLGAIQGLFGGLLGSATTSGKGRKAKLDEKIRKAAGG